MSVQTTNKEIEFRVKLLSMEDGDDPNISSYWVSVNDGGSYEPYMVLEQAGVLHLYGTGHEILHPGTWRELLMLVLEGTAHRRDENKEAQNV